MRKHVHLVGIGGIGMSGIAELLVASGHQVSGSDLVASSITRRLESLGVHFAEGHDSCHVDDADLVVVSTAVPPENPERVAAAERGIPIVPRGAMLAELTKLKRTVAIVGSHGKTTTTAMTALLLDAAGLDPTAVIGGRVSAFGSNARVGHGPLMVVEADESDRSFLRLSPEIAVLTNIDDEHLDAYDGMEDLEAAFLDFASKNSERRCLVACVDDPRLRRLVSQVAGRVVTYAIDEPTANVCASDVVLEPSQSRFLVTTPGETNLPFEVTLAAPGRHNVQNALAAITVALELGVHRDALAVALGEFTGPDRRFQVVGKVDDIVVVDDYAHHPTEIAAVLATARLWSPSRLRVVFQPHRYSRTLRLLDRFGEVLTAADELILTDVYAASETPIPGATAAALAGVVARTSAMPVRCVGSLDEAVDAAVCDARAGDLLVTIGAGSIGSVPARIVKALRSRRSKEDE